MTRELEEPGIWNTPERAQELGRERSQLDTLIGTLDRLNAGLTDASELLDLAVEEGDAATVQGVEADAARLEESVRQLEFRRMFPGEMDSHNAFLDIQAGAGGTEAQDWAQMLLRMYLKWGDARGFRTEVIDENPGEVAGMKSATVSFTGDYAYGWLRTETGVHRLVRKSPFDSGNRRHTSFASVFVSPEVDEDINIEDPNEVLWALTTRFQPATDMFVIPRSITSSLEPSAEADGFTSKLMLDLTIKENFRGEVAEPTEGMREMVLQKWKEYGFR